MFRNHGLKETNSTTFKKELNCEVRQISNGMLGYKNWGLCLVALGHDYSIQITVHCFRIFFFGISAEALIVFSYSLKLEFGGQVQIREWYTV